MDQSPTFARHFARLVWLLMNDAGNVDEQKMSLRALATISKLGDVRLHVSDAGLLANTQPVAAALTGVHELTRRMAAHSARGVSFAAGARAADLLAAARALAGEATASGELVAPKAVTWELQPGVGAPGEPASVAPAAVEASAAAATVPTEAPTVIIAPGARPTVRIPVAEPAADAPPPAGGDTTRATPEQLLAALDAARDSATRMKILEDLVTLAEHMVRVVKAPLMASIFHEIITREAMLPEGDARAAYAAAIRRLSKPAMLRAVASLIPKKPEKRQMYLDVLVRTGPDGAEAMVEQITQAVTPADRKQLLELFRALEHAVPALTRMLGDSRWFVVRNAADLLGQLEAREAEGALMELLRHADERVRRAATNALMRLGSPDTLRGAYEAVTDTSPQVRMEAAANLSVRKDARTAATLITAIEEERNVDVQIAMIAALGRVATPDAVKKLIRMAEPDGRLFRKKTTQLRIAAVEALGEAKTPVALAALKALTSDRIRDVREAATRALSRPAH